MMKNMKKSKGMLTIEAALVMPLVIYIVFIMIFTFLFIYTRVYVAISTNYGTSLATAQWYSRGSEFDVSNTKGGSVIGEAIGTAFSNDKKEDVLKEIIEKKILSGTPMTINPLNIKVDAKNYIIGQKVEVTVDATYKLPLSGLFKLMGMSKDGTVTDVYTKTINITNTEDNIRTITYAKSLLEKSDVDGLLKKAETALKGVRK